MLVFMRGVVVFAAVVLGAACVPKRTLEPTLTGYRFEPAFAMWRLDEPDGECPSGGCFDYEYSSRYTAEELGELAIAGARAKHCVCAIAVADAAGRKDPGVYNERIRVDTNWRACIDQVEPEVRRKLKARASRPGTIAHCLGHP